MFYKIFSLLILLSSTSVLINGQTTYPIASRLAKPCLNILNETNVLTDCYNKAMALWPVQKNGQKDDKWEKRDTCCVEYEQIDCKIKAIKSGRCTGNFAQATLFFENQLIDYWNTSHCLTIPYNSGICKSNITLTSPSPTPNPIQLPDECFKKCNNNTNSCLAKIRSDWNVTQDELESNWDAVPDMNFCCATWQVSDCFMDAFRKKCYADVISTEQKQRDQYRKYLEGEKCIKFPYNKNTCSQNKIKGSGKGIAASLSTINKVVYISLLFLICQNNLTQ